MLVITLGDPLSVNIELVHGLVPRLPAAVPAVLVGSSWHWRDQLGRLGLSAPRVEPLGGPVAPGRPGVFFLDVGTVADARPAEELAAPVRGALAVRSLAQVGALTAAVPAGRRLAVITGPIDKHACVLAGFAHGGQTEYFEELWGAPAVMTLAGSRLRVGLVTNHLPLKDVPKALTAGTVLAKLALFVRTLREAFGCKRPRVAVCGVNPHAGDGGLFGDEESRCLAPALAAFKGDADVTGPVPADTAFYRAYHGAFDGVLAMYHDQGLGPLKTVHFDDAVNLSGGLPHFRASPDHGPARDLFLRKAASPASFALTLDLAAAYLRGGFR